MIRIRAVAPLADFRVRIELTNGDVRIVDLKPFLVGPVFDPLRRNPAAFRAVRVDPELGTIVWPNGADICPDVLVHGRTPARLQDGPPQAAPKRRRAPRRSLASSRRR